MSVEVDYKIKFISGPQVRLFLPVKHSTFICLIHITYSEMTPSSLVSNRNNIIMAAITYCLSVRQYA